MDKREKALDVVKKIHEYQDGTLEPHEFVGVVCDYYDFIKETNLTKSDLQFLKKIANTAGIPHYFDLLSNFQKKSILLESFSLTAFSAHIFESTLHTSKEYKVHRYQRDILSQFEQGKKNRYFLSASTSFGKTHLVYEIIAKMGYKNMVLIFPTIALLSENLEKLHSSSLYTSFKIHTLSDVNEEDLQGDNIFVYTPERFLSVIEKHDQVPLFDFIFIDEVYKIDNEYIIDEEERKENERDISYRIAAFYSMLNAVDIFLAGPYIEEYSASFDAFLTSNQIVKFDFNQYEIVGKSYTVVKGARELDLGGGLKVQFEEGENGKVDRLKRIVNLLVEAGENCIVYCPTPSAAERYSKFLRPLIEYELSSQSFKDFVEHVSSEYGRDWVVTKGLKNGIGVHHGLIPKYIQKEIVAFLNNGTIKALISTTTITEGVNTSAKNLIITNNKKGNKELKKFDAKNIAGRAGRFLRHYSGRVVVLQNDFLDDVNSDAEQIGHKNYDLTSRKEEIDLFYTSDNYLSNEDKARKKDILSRQSAREIPDQILNLFKVVSRADKIDVYDCIFDLDSTSQESILELIRKVNASSQVMIDWDGLQVVLDCVSPIVNSSLKSLIDRKTIQGKGKHSILIPILHNYLESGFTGLIAFKKEEQGKNTDTATREAARFVFNTAKYQLVKFLGVFNVIYKFHISKSNNIDFEEVSGVDRLLTKLEYNALTDVGRRVSDFGVPARVLEYYENEQAENIKGSFDDFEKRVFESVQNILNR